MFMLKCLVKLQNCTVQQVFCNPNSDIPMPFATVEDAHKFADQNVIGKKFENIEVTVNLPSSWVQQYRDLRALNASRGRGYCHEVCNG